MFRDNEILYTRLPDDYSNWMARFNTDIVSGLRSHNISVTVIPQSGQPEDSGRSERFNHRLNVLKDFAQTEITDNDIVLVSCPLRCSLDQLMWVSEVVKQKKPLFACYTLTGTFIDEDWISKNTPWVQYLEKIWYNKADIIFVPTDYFKKEMVKAGYDGGKIFNVGVPVDYSHIQENSSPKENLIIFNHRMNSDKGPAYFLRLTDDLSGEFSGLKYRISTNQTEREFWNSIDPDLIRPLMERIRKNPTLEIIFNKTKADYYSLLNRAYIAPCFSVHETFGFSVAEALAAGCLPIVPTRLTYPELVENDHDLLYESGVNPETDYRQALEKIRYWLHHPISGSGKSAEIKRYVCKYDPPIVAGKILSILNEYLRASEKDTPFLKASIVNAGH